MSGIYAKGICDCAFFSCQCEVEVQQQIQKLVISILRNASQKRRNFTVMFGGDRVFAHVRSDKSVSNRSGIGGTQNKAVPSITTADQSVIAGV